MYMMEGSLKVKSKFVHVRYMNIHVFTIFSFLKVKKNEIILLK